MNVSNLPPNTEIRWCNEKKCVLCVISVVLQSDWQELIFCQYPKQFELLLSKTASVKTPKASKKMPSVPGLDSSLFKQAMAEQTSHGVEMKGPKIGRCVGVVSVSLYVLCAPACPCVLLGEGRQQWNEQKRYQKNWAGMDWRQTPTRPTRRGARRQNSGSRWTQRRTCRHIWRGGAWGADAPSPPCTTPKSARTNSDLWCVLIIVVVISDDHRY